MSNPPPPPNKVSPSDSGLTENFGHPLVARISLAGLGFAGFCLILAAVLGGLSLPSWLNSAYHSQRETSQKERNVEDAQSADNQAGEPHPAAVQSEGSPTPGNSVPPTLQSDSTYPRIDPKILEQARQFQAEAQVDVTAFMQAQQAYYLKQLKFAESINDLGTVIAQDTQAYSYRILPGYDSNSVFIHADPKDAALMSIVGVVYVVKHGEASPQIDTGLCISNQMGMPTAPSPQLDTTSAIPVVVCASGTYAGD